MRRDLIRVDHALDDFHLAIGHLAQHGHGLRVVRVTPRQRQQFLLEIPNRGVVAERFFALEPLPQQRHLLERVEPAVRAHNLQRTLDRHERERIVLVLAVQQDQTRQLVEQRGRILAVARLNLFDLGEDLPLLLVEGGNVERGTRRGERADREHRGRELQRLVDTDRDHGPS